MKKIITQRDGGILPVILVILIVFSLLVISLFSLSNHSARETVYEVQRSQAFWLAEAGLRWSESDIFEGGDGTTAFRALGEDSAMQFKVESADDGASRIATGSVRVGGKIIERAIKFWVIYVATPFENAVYGGNMDAEDWALVISGNQHTPGVDGPVIPLNGNDHFADGNDLLPGNVDVNGAFYMKDESKVDVPDPNNYGVAGDVTASGTITREVGTAISGTEYNSSSTDYTPPDLYAMDYANTNVHDWNIAKEFNDRGITSGRLPSDHPLYDLVIKNPSDRSGQINDTDGDDFFFEPTGNNYGNNTPSTGEFPLNFGEDKLYYVDGHVWFGKSGPYGFQVEGKSVVVSSRDVHISDNLTYKDRSAGGDLLALVALGQYTGETRSGYGDIYFGDPEHGTTFTVDAFMFANNDFLYNTRASDGSSQEPVSGFRVFGNFMAVNQVRILRDWYHDGTGYKPAIFDPVTDAWYDADDWFLSPRILTPLTADQLEPYEDSNTDGFKHYAMVVGYDDRIRDAATQMKGLPQGGGVIPAGIERWEEVSVQ